MFAGESGCWAIIALLAAFKNASGMISAGPMTKNKLVNSKASSTSPLLSKPDQKGPKSGRAKIHIIALPAMCDILSTTLLNVGLLFVVPSIYQMTRGTVVVFSALFSIWFFNRRIDGSKWLALFLIVLGVAVVSLAGTAEEDPTSDALPHSSSALHALKFSLDEVQTSSSSPASSTHALRTIIGVCIITFASIFAAAQFALEESIMSRYPIAPLELVGYEGVSGLIVILCAQAIAHITYGSTDNGRGSIFDIRTSFSQVTHNPRIYTASILMMAATGIYNYFALTVTRSLSATHRTTIDAFRTVLIWMVGLAFGWESFKWLQLIGFMGLVVGNLIFNDVVRPPIVRFVRASQEETGYEEREHN